MSYQFQISRHDDGRRIDAVLRGMWERGWSFIKKAGTIILLSTIVIWFLTSLDGWTAPS